MSILINFGGQFLFGLIVYVLFHFKVTFFSNIMPIVIALVYSSVVTYSIICVVNGTLYVYGTLNGYCIIFWVTAVLVLLLLFKRSMPINFALYSSILVTFYSEVLYEEFAMSIVHGLSWALGATLVLMPFIFFIHDIKIKKELIKLSPFLTISNLLAFEVYLLMIDWILPFMITEGLCMIARTIGFVSTSFIFYPKVSKYWRLRE